MNERVKYITGPTILLHSGKYFDLLEPEKSEFTIEDIAHGLSNTCRFAGQCRRFYSVAEHCVHASYQVYLEFALDALMHDAAEAFIGDVTRPLKTLLQDYKKIETAVSEAIKWRFGLSFVDSPEIKKVDLQMLRTEQKQLMRNNDMWDAVKDVEPLDIVLPCWSPREAMDMFLERFHALYLPF